MKFREARVVVGVGGNVFSEVYLSSFYFFFNVCEDSNSCGGNDFVLWLSCVYPDFHFAIPKRRKKTNGQKK